MPEFEETKLHRTQVTNILLEAIAYQKTDCRSIDARTPTGFLRYLKRSISIFIWWFTISQLEITERSPVVLRTLKTA